MSASLTGNRETRSVPTGIEAPEIGVPCVLVYKRPLSQKAL
jgi:hypothetical protein